MNKKEKEAFFAVLKYLDSQSTRYNQYVSDEGKAYLRGHTDSGDMVLLSKKEYKEAINETSNTIRTNIYKSAYDSGYTAAKKRYKSWWQK